MFGYPLFPPCKIIYIFLVSVSEVLVLLVGQSSPDFGSQELLLSLLAAVVAALVRPDVVEEQQEGGEGAASLSTHDGQLGRSVIRSVLGLESLGSNNVAEREGTGNNGGSKGTLGGTGTVGNSPLEMRLVTMRHARYRGQITTNTVENGQRGDDSIDQIDTGQQTRFIGFGQERHQSASNDAMYQVSIRVL